MQPVSIRIDSYEYANLQYITAQQLEWVYRCFSASKCRGVEIEPILARMNDKYFGKSVDSIRFPKTGKLFCFEYYEAKALWEFFATSNDLGIINLRAKIDKALVDWKPSYTQKTIKHWYESPTGMDEVFGEYQEVGQDQYEVVNHVFNTLKPYEKSEK